MRALCPANSGFWGVMVGIWRTEGLPGLFRGVEAQVCQLSWTRTPHPHANPNPNSTANPNPTPTATADSNSNPNPTANPNP